MKTFIVKRHLSTVLVFKLQFFSHWPTQNAMSVFMSRNFSHSLPRPEPWACTEYPAMIRTLYIGSIHVLSKPTLGTPKRWHLCPVSPSSEGSQITKYPTLWRIVTVRRFCLQHSRRIVLPLGAYVFPRSQCSSWDRARPYRWWTTAIYRAVPRYNNAAHPGVLLGLTKTPRIAQSIKSKVEDASNFLRI